MAVLVIAEHNNAALNDATHKVVTAAAKFGGDVHVLVAGEGAGAVAEAAGKIDGVAKVIHADGASLAKQMAEPLEALIVPMMANYDALFVPATTTGKNAAPRIAAKLDVMQLSDIDRKSTRLNSSHDQISYAVFCLKKQTENAADK